MNFRQIEAFRAVMVTGSATAAAKLLFITQPAISRLIADLEFATKLKLFVRKPNRLEATPEAQALCRRYCQPARRQLAHGGYAGVLRQFFAVADCRILQNPSQHQH